MNPSILQRKMEKGYFRTALEKTRTHLPKVKEETAIASRHLIKNQKKLDARTRLEIIYKVCIQGESSFDISKEYRLRRQHVINTVSKAKQCLPELKILVAQ